MSMHKVPLTTSEEDGLRKHGLPVGAPSQLSDVFRQGMAWQASQPKPAPVLLTDEEIDDVYIEGKRVWIGKLKIARAIESAVHRKNGWGV